MGSGVHLVFFMGFVDCSWLSLGLPSIAVMCTIGKALLIHKSVSVNVALCIRIILVTTFVIDKSVSKRFNSYSYFCQFVRTCILENVLVEALVSWSTTF